jgi:hypothetical protein
MQRNKIILTILGLLVLPFILVQKVSAVTAQISITDLPAYINYQGFKLSYSAINNDPSTISVQFYSNKEGGAYTAFGPVLTSASDQVGVDAGQIGESDKKYCFKVEMVAGGSASDETCTTFDQSAPGEPGSYSKEKVNPNYYIIRWHTPNNDDFSRVFVYRGEEPGFSADGSHKIAEVGGAKDTDAKWEDNGLDGTKEYYYALRSIDFAGNSSALVGDRGTVAGTSTVSTQTTQPSSNVIVVPEESPEGEVLSEEAPEEAVEENVLTQAVNSLTTGSNKNLAIAFGLPFLAVIGVLVYLRLRKR